MYNRNVRVLPFQRLRFHIDAPAEVVENRLGAMVASGRFYVRSPPQPFRGTIQGAHFKVMRVLGAWARNSWQPVIVGTIVPVPDGTEVRVRMRLHLLVAAFMSIWFGGLLCATGPPVWRALARRFGSDARTVGSSGGADLALVAAIALAGYAIMSISFWTEVSRARTLLRDGLGCRDLEPNRIVK